MPKPFRDTSELVTPYEEELVQLLQRMPQQAFDREAVAARLKARVIGFDAMIDDLVRLLAIRENAPQQRTPTSVFVAGKSGSGKTSIAQELAEALDRPFVHIDGTQLQDSTSLSKVWGMAAGYVGAEHGGLLSNALAQNQRSVVCVDELTDAYPGLRQSFLTVLERGTFERPADHALVECRQTIFIFASNAGVGRVNLPRAQSHADITNQANVLRTTLLSDGGVNGWTPQFLNRFQRLYWFGAPLVEHLPRIVAKLVDDRVRSIDPEITLAHLQRDAAHELALGIDQRVLSDEGVRGVSNRLENRLAEAFMALQELVECRASSASVRVGLVLDAGVLRFVEWPAA